MTASIESNEAESHLGREQVAVSVCLAVLKQSKCLRKEKPSMIWFIRPCHFTLNVLSNYPYISTMKEDQPWREHYAERLGTTRSFCSANTMMCDPTSVGSISLSHFFLHHKIKLLNNNLHRCSQLWHLGHQQNCSKILEKFHLNTWPL